jgi:copper oxidase (laccase) domain-containing protein
MHDLHQIKAYFMLFNNKLTKQLNQGLTLFNHSSNQVKKVEKKNFDLKRVTEVYDQKKVRLHQG